jgi:hypothetical protein
MTSVVLTTLANAVHCSAQPASAVIPHCSKFLVEVALVERLAFSGRNILWLVESMQEFERFSLWLVDKVRCAGLHSRRELAPGHHGWLLPSAVALVLPHTYPSLSHSKRTLNFWSRLSSQLRESNVSSLAVLRLEASMIGWAWSQCVVAVNGLGQHHHALCLKVRETKDAKLHVSYRISSGRQNHGTCIVVAQRSSLDFLSKHLMIGLV